MKTSQISRLWLFSSTNCSLNEFSSLADLIELRKLRKARHGIDVEKLNKGDIEKKGKRPREEGEQSGLRKGAHEEEDYACHVKLDDSRLG